MKNQRIASKLGNIDEFGADPRRVDYAGADLKDIDYDEKYKSSTPAIQLRA